MSVILRVLLLFSFSKGRKSANNGELSGALLVLFTFLLAQYNTHDCVRVCVFNVVVLFTFLPLLALLDQQ